MSEFFVKMECPFCKKTLAIDSRYIGTIGKCKYCNNNIKVEAPAFTDKQKLVAEGKNTFTIFKNTWIGCFSALLFLIMMSIVIISCSTILGERAKTKYINTLKSNTNEITSTQPTVNTIQSIKSIPDIMINTNETEIEKITKKIYNENDLVNVGYTGYKVFKSGWTYHLHDNPYLDKKPNAMFLFVDIWVQNTDKQARTIPPFYLEDSDGNTYQTDSKSLFVENSIGMLDSLNPKVSKRGFIVFDIPKKNGYKLKVSGGYWSTDVAYINLNPIN